MTTITIAKRAGEWREAVLERDGYKCQSQEHDPKCQEGLMATLQVHHIVFKSHISKRFYWLVENGITLSAACHALAHRGHNASIGYVRANEAVRVLNLLEAYLIPPFRKKAI